MIEICNSFPGYEFSPYGIDKSRYEAEPTTGKSIYMGEDPSEGGYVFAKPGMYTNVVTYDVAGLHPASILALNKFGEYTQRYRDIRDARIAIKHHDFEKARNMLDGKLAKYLTDESDADKLSKALKLVLNSTYGFCSATFDNPFKDSRDLDNIVAKRGALFMISLKNEVIKQGFEVIHCKTDSIKIADTNDQIAEFISAYGIKYGYEFEVESEYEKICLVNRAVYVAKERNGHWTATGAQFAVPYVFKTLFSHEPIIFEDLCETKSVTSALYLDFNESLPDVTAAEKELAKWEKDVKASGMTPSEIRDILNNPIPGSEVEALQKDISKGHRYQFVGRVGLFCPMQEGAGGGLLMREKDGKYSAATGTKGYRWMEAEMVRNLGLEDKIDRSYYDALVEEARDTINKFGDFELFVSDEPVPELPF